MGLVDEGTDMLREFQFSLTTDTTSGRATGYLLRLDPSGEWSWVADMDFGPFDTGLDVCRWLTQRLCDQKAFTLR